jgi:hypothetical protein
MLLVALPSAGGIFLFVTLLQDRSAHKATVAQYASERESRAYRYGQLGLLIPDTLGKSVSGDIIDRTFFSRRRVTLIAFLSEYACKPCVEHEVAWWDSLRARYGNRFGIVVVADYPERVRILRLAKEYKLDFPIVHQQIEFAFEHFHVTVTPRTFLVSDLGRVLLQHWTRPDDLADIDSFYAIVESYLM